MSNNELNSSILETKPPEVLEAEHRFSLLLPFLTVLSAMLSKIMLVFYIDSDSFWSLAIGRWISQHSSIPHVDVFSWTVNGKPWLTSEWLFCWIIYQVNIHMRFIGVAVMIIIVYLITGYFIFATCRSLSKTNATEWISCIGMWALIAYSATPRAYVFTFMFLSIMMYILRVKTESRWIYIMPVMFVLWANIQNTAVFGVAILAVETVAGAVFYRNHKLWPVLGLCIAAICINPAGMHIWTDLFKAMGRTENKLVMEWLAPNLSNKILLCGYVFLGVTAVFSSFSKPWSLLQRNERMLLLWFWLAFFYSLTTMRAFNYALFFWILMVSTITPIWFKERFNLKPVFAVVVFGIMTAFLLLQLPKMGWMSANPASLPYSATEYIIKHPKLQNNLFNDYMYGGYLMMQGIKVFIDARADLYIDNGVLQDYVAANNVLIPPEIVLDKYKVNTMLLSRSSKLAIYIDGRNGWKKAYEDDNSVIYVRKGVLK